MCRRRISPARSKKAAPKVHGKRGRAHRRRIQRKKKVNSCSCLLRRRRRRRHRVQQLRRQRTGRFRHQNTISSKENNTYGSNYHHHEALGWKSCSKCKHNCQTVQVLYEICCNLTELLTRDTIPTSMMHHRSAIRQTTTWRLKEWWKEAKKSKREASGPSPTRGPSAGPVEDRGLPDWKTNIGRNEENEWPQRHSI